MTEKEKGGAPLILKRLLPFSELMIATAFFIMLFATDTVKEGAYRGLVLTAGTILPSTFPFMILGDFISCFVTNRGLGISERSVCRIFNISKSECGILTSGLLCGFPSSARASADAFKQGRLQEERAVILTALTSNPSPSFTIGAVGAGLLSDKTSGALIFLSMLISVIIASHIFVKKRQDFSFPDITSRQKYSFVESVRGAAVAAITVFSFVTVFCALIELLKIIIGDGVIFSLILPFTEVSTALVHLIKECNLPSIPKNLLIGFSVGFGGLSANLQCAAFLSEAGIKLKKFFIIKLTLGIFTALFTALLCALYSTILLVAQA